MFVTKQIISYTRGTGKSTEYITILCILITDKPPNYVHKWPQKIGKNSELSYDPSWVHFLDSTIGSKRRTTSKDRHH